MSRVLLALMLVAVPILSAGQSDTPIRRPEIRVGDSWTYRGTNMMGPGTQEYEQRVSYTDDKVILLVITRKSDGKEFDSSSTLEWNPITAGTTGNMFRPAAIVFRFPMQIGETYPIKYEVLRPRVTTVAFHVTGSAKVMGWEMVEVPAGKFNAVKMQVEALWHPSDGTPEFLRQITVWYSTEVRRWVKMQATGTGSGGEELLRYKLNED